jgi:hypothetical protein
MLAALGLGGRTVHAQAAPLPYWAPGWPIGFGADASSQSPATYGNLIGDSDARGGRFAYTRYNFSSGWFVGNEGGGSGFGINGLSQEGAFGGFHYEGVQFGYNLQNGLPVTLFAGVDSLKLDPGIGAPGSPFASTSSVTAGYSAHAGIELRPTSNLDLSLGVGFTQLSGDANSLVLPGASPVGFGHR